MTNTPSSTTPDLGRIPLFSGLKAGEKKALMDAFSPPKAALGGGTGAPAPPPRASYSMWKAGEVFAKQGEFTGQFHVIISGVVSAFRAESSGETRVLESLGPESWFGEVSALSNQPALATLKAETPCLTLTLAPELFKSLYGRSADFRGRIDENYRERGLVIHLRTAPLFRGLPEAELRVLRKEVAFRSFAANQVIAAADEEATAVYLVRSGAVKCSRGEADGRERILGYFMNNSSFGERCLSGTADERRWPGDHVAMTPTDLLVVPREVLQRFSAEALSLLQSTARLILEEEAGQETGLYQANDTPDSARNMTELELEFMVKKGSAKGGEALVIDIERCVRCNACVESCAAVHEDHVPRLSKRGGRLAIGPEEAATHDRYNLATSCYNCQVPGCMLSCTFGAIRRDVLGLIRFDYQNCVGCAQCVEACPYDVIRLTPPPTTQASAETSLWQRLPLIGKLFAPQAPKEAAPSAPAVNPYGIPIQAKAVKCDLCAGLPFQACVYNCPCSAIKRFSVRELLRRQGGDSQGTFSFTRD